MRISEKRRGHDQGISGIYVGSRKDEMGTATSENINDITGNIWSNLEVICFTSSVSFLVYLITLIFC